MDVRVWAQRLPHLSRYGKGAAQELRRFVAAAAGPRNGSAATIQHSLVDLGAKSGHPELPKIPWALWGHSEDGLRC
jgi:hypothetical protein